MVRWLRPSWILVGNVLRMCWRADSQLFTTFCENTKSGGFSCRTYYFLCSRNSNIVHCSVQCRVTIYGIVSTVQISKLVLTTKSRKLVDRLAGRLQSRTYAPSSGGGICSDDTVGGP